MRVEVYETGAHRRFGQYSTVTSWWFFAMFSAAYNKEKATMRTVLAFALLSVLATPSLADLSESNNSQLMTHNGSLMKLFWDDGEGTTFEIYYVQPRDGLNVARGTLLVDGYVQELGHNVTAVARTFKKGCAPALYDVTGRTDTKGNLYLSGNAPLRKGCKIIGYSDTNNSSLVFKIVP